MLHVSVLISQISRSPILYAYNIVYTYIFDIM